MGDDDVATRALSPHALAQTLPVGTASEELTFGGTIGRYLVLGVLGRGGMGVVYEAYDPVLDRKIAVKLLREVAADDVSAGRARMQREAQALARLIHPNVITVHDVSEQRGAMYIAMELVAGKTLRDWQDKRSWREVLGVYLAAARGLGAAHAAGLIHRDFKPDNVLVGDDGRVRVTDFGLARLAVDAPVTPVHATPSQLASNLTAAGTVMGTPSYMAPEQIDGLAVDERSDQCSWCIAAWEAIYGEQPFVAGNLAIRSAAMKSDVPRPPARTHVPRGVARVLQRGLAPEAARRWPDMPALIAEVERAMSKRRVALAAGGLAAVAVIATVFVVGRTTGELRRDCTSAAAPADELWTPALADQLGRGFAATGAPFAGDSAAAFGRSVAAWRTHWQAVAIESCEATRVSGTQSEATLDLRTACLMRRRDELRTTIAALAHTDRKGVEGAPTLGLPDLDACSDPAALRGTPPPPRDVMKRAAIESRLDALEGATQGALALDRAKALVGDAKAQIAAARELGWRPLTARARRALEAIYVELGQGKAARTTALAAAADASAAGDPDTIVAIYLELAEVEARLTSEFALGDSWVELATGTLAHLGPRPTKQLLALRTKGLIARRAGRPESARDAYLAALPQARALGAIQELSVLADLGLAENELGDLAAAREHLDRALRLARTELGGQHPKVAQVLHDLGTVVYREGHYAAAEQAFRAALAIREPAYGVDSVEVAQTIQAIGNTEIMEDKVADAEQHFAQAIRLLEARLGPDHPDVATAYNDIGGAYHRTGHYQEAFANAQHVLALREKALGPDHPDVAQSLVNLAIEAKNLGDWAVIEPSYRRALSLFAKAYGADSFEIAATYINYGEAKRAQGELDAAADCYERSRAILAKQLGEGHPMLAHVWNGLGQVELARGRLDAAVPLLERAVAMRAHDQGDATDLAESRFALARAITKTDHARAVTLATAARDVYRTAGAGYAKRLAAIEEWLRHDSGVTR